MTAWIHQKLDQGGGAGLPKSGNGCWRSRVAGRIADIRANPNRSSMFKSEL
jgi:hypothetical protein